MFEYALVFENPGETVKEEYYFYRLAEEIKKQSEYLTIQGFSVHLDLAEELIETVWMANPFLIQRLDRQSLFQYSPVWRSSGGG